VKRTELIKEGLRQLRIWKVGGEPSAGIGEAG
jgi:hypothetical protein